MSTLAVDNSRYADLRRDGAAIFSHAYSSEVITGLLHSIRDLPSAHAHRNLLRVAAVRQFATATDTMHLIAPVLRNSARPVRAILFDKIPEANWKVSWHQDLSIAVKQRHEIDGFGPWSLKEGVPHVQPPAVILENILTLRLHLDDCFHENGPVRFLPGTHAMGILQASKIAELRRDIKELSATTAAGGVLLMRPLLLHASSPAVSPSHRRVIHIEYAADPLPAPLEWHES